MSIAASAPHKQAPFSKIVSAVAIACTQLRAGASLNSVIRPALLHVPQESRPAAQALIYESVRRRAKTDALLGLLCSRQPSAEVLSMLEAAFAAIFLGRLAVFTVVSETVTAAKANPQTRAASGLHQRRTSALSARAGQVGADGCNAGRSPLQCATLVD